ncbi:MAG: dihydroorotate dehydrogenase-like protein [Anaerolineae bacterium]|nr:MAG: dihydroorotate dehydrogenase-like protein [Anaerolineae bacterium]
MTDLTTRYLGLTLKNPILASASPLTKKLDTAKKLDEAGVGAIVMYSLFEEQIIQESLELDHYLTRGTESFAEAQTYLPDTGLYTMGPGKYLDHLTAVKKSVSVPVIGSLNGVSAGGWTRYARYMQDAGADAIELNLYYLATDPNLPGQELEEAQIELVANVKASVSIPVSVKLSPFITSIPNFAKRLVEAGADGLVLFNRFYQPDFDLDNLEVQHTLVLSTSEELRLPLRWVSILYGRIQADLALTTGVHTAADVLKSMMAGAQVVMIASEILKNGYNRIPDLLANMTAWMEEHEYHSIQQMQGSMSQKAVREPAAFERANYMRVLGSFRDLP